MTNTCNVPLVLHPETVEAVLQISLQLVHILSVVDLQLQKVDLMSACYTVMLMLPRCASLWHNGRL